MRQPVENVAFVQGNIVKLFNAFQGCEILQGHAVFDVQGEAVLLVGFREITFRQRGDIRDLGFPEVQVNQLGQVLDPLDRTYLAVADPDLPELFKGEQAGNILQVLTAFEDDLLQVPQFVDAFQVRKGLGHDVQVLETCQLAEPAEICQGAGLDPYFLFGFPIVQDIVPAVVVPLIPEIPAILVDNDVAGQLEACDPFQCGQGQGIQFIKTLQANVAGPDVPVGVGILHFAIVEPAFLHKGFRLLLQLRGDGQAVAFQPPDGRQIRYQIQAQEFQVIIPAVIQNVQAAQVLQPGETVQLQICGLDAFQGGYGIGTGQFKIVHM